MRIIFSLALMGCMAAQAQSLKVPQTWPQKPVRIIVPLAAGGSVDIIARMLATRLSERLGQQFVVDNRPGAGSTLGVAIAARANPDGYTWLMMSPAFAGSAVLYKLPYDPVTDIVPVAMVAAGSMFLSVHPSMKAHNMNEFLGLAHAQPGKLKYGSGGIGSSTHLATELLRQMTKTDMVHVPYKGIGAAMVDLLAGQIQFYIAPGAALMPHVTTGKLRLLAITTRERSPEFADLPAIHETVPGYQASFWYGVGAPRGTPHTVVDRLSQEIAAIIKYPDIQKRLQGDDLKPAHVASEAFAKIIRGDIEQYARVVKTAGIKVE